MGERIMWWDQADKKSTLEGGVIIIYLLLLYLEIFTITFKATNQNQLRLIPNFKLLPLVYHRNRLK